MKHSIAIEWESILGERADWLLVVIRIACEPSATGVRFEQIAYNKAFVLHKIAAQLGYERGLEQLRGRMR